MVDGNQPQQVPDPPKAGADVPPALPRYGMADFLMDRDVPCPKCTFNLRGLTVDSCPECNATIQLIVAQPDLVWRLRRRIVITAVLVCVANVVSVASAQPANRLSGSFWIWAIGGIVSFGVLVGVFAALVRYVMSEDSQAATSRLFVSTLGAIRMMLCWAVLSGVARLLL